MQRIHVGNLATGFSGAVAHVRLSQEGA